MVYKESIFFNREGLLNRKVLLYSIVATLVITLYAESIPDFFWDKDPVQFALKWASLGILVDFSYEWVTSFGKGHLSVFGASIYQVLGAYGIMFGSYMLFPSFQNMIEEVYASHQKLLLTLSLVSGLLLSLLINGIWLAVLSRKREKKKKDS